jgi:hypothetical protein
VISVDKLFFVAVALAVNGKAYKLQRVSHLSGFLFNSTDNAKSIRIDFCVFFLNNKQLFDY